MGEIIINNAPQAYRNYLKIGDTHKGEKGNDGGINEISEAKRAAEKFCSEKPTGDCQEFLEYLEQSGYAFPELRIKVATFFEKQKEIERKIEKQIRTLCEKKFFGWARANWEARMHAAYDLGQFAKSDISPELKARIVDSLLIALEDRDQDIKISAAYALGQFAKSDISPELKAEMAAPLIKVYLKHRSRRDPGPFLSDRDWVKMSATSALDALAESNISPELKAKIREASQK